MAVRDLSSSPDLTGSSHVTSVKLFDLFESQVFIHEIRIYLVSQDKKDLCTKVLS